MFLLEIKMMNIIKFGDINKNYKLNVGSMIVNNVVLIESIECSQFTFGGISACTVCACGFCFYTSSKKEYFNISIGLCEKIINGACNIWKKYGNNRMLDVEECLELPDIKKTNLRIEKLINCLVINSDKKEMIINDISLNPILYSIYKLCKHGCKMNIPLRFVFIHSGKSIFISVNKNNGECIIIDTHIRNTITGLIPNNGDVSFNGEILSYSGVKSHFENIYYASRFLVQLNEKHNVKQVGINNSINLLGNLYLMKRI